MPPPPSEAEKDYYDRLSALDTVEQAVANVRGSDDFDTASRVAGQITAQIGVDLSQMEKGLRAVHKVSLQHLTRSAKVLALLRFNTADASVRQDFVNVNRRLKGLYRTTVAKLLHGLCFLLAHLGADKVLRDLLIRDGAAEFLTRLLSHPTASYFSLRTLSILTSHAGPTEGAIMAKHLAIPLVKMAGELDGDDPRYPLCISVLMHGSYVGNDKTVSSRPHACYSPG